MQRRDAIMERGRIIYETCDRRGYTYCSRRFADPDAALPPAYLLVEDRFTTGHDDSATFVELIDEKENILKSWMFEGPEPRCFEDPAVYDDDCLVYYLKETLKLEVVQSAWNRKVGEALF